MPVLNWVGKDKVVNHHQDVPFMTLEKKYSFNDEQSENMIIHGDNLYALKSLLPKYAGKIDIIYIDPPYNTGNENWIYNDNVNDPTIKKWLGEVVGKEGEDLSRHDKWLCMMYPRLRLLKKLLKETEGIMFISMDEHEIGNLLQVCHELFGQKNVEVLIWRKNGKQGNTKKINRFKNTHEYIVVCYMNKNEKRVGKCKLMPNWKHEQTNPDNDPRGKWASGVISRDEEHSDPESENYYSITAPSGRIITREFYYPKEEIEALMADNRIYFPKDGDGVPRLKIFEGEEQFYYFDSIIDEMGTFTDAGDELETFFGEEAKEFQTPKPSKIIRELVRASGPKNSIVLDAFAGSGTTAQSVLELNKEDGGTRKFILIELMDYAERFVANRAKKTIEGYGEHKATGGSFGFYELGMNIFNEKGGLNTELPLEEIKKFVFYTETQNELSQTNNKYFLGSKGSTGYYFLFNKNESLSLNSKSLSFIDQKFESYVIYAESCSLSEDFLQKNNIMFKKIPNDLQKY